jgi:peptidoglycan-associated lipoprotein
LQVGSGVDLHLSLHIALRPLQADWIRTEFDNASTNVQNNLRLGAGMVFRLR